MQSPTGEQHRLHKYQLPSVMVTKSRLLKPWEASLLQTTNFQGVGFKENNGAPDYPIPRFETSAIKTRAPPSRLKRPGDRSFQDEWRRPSLEVSCWTLAETKHHAEVTVCGGAWIGIHCEILKHFTILYKQVKRCVYVCKLVFRLEFYDQTETYIKQSSQMLTLW